MPVTELSTSSQPKIFVTGGTGLVGFHVLKALANEGRHVTALYRNQIPETPFSDKIEWVKGDILDIVFLEKALLSFDQVYHCAAVVSFHPDDAEIMMRTNVEGTANIVNAALSAGVKKLCYVSSVAALGNTNSLQPVTEIIDYANRHFDSRYGLSKFLAEKEIWRAIGEGLNAVIINPSIILGAGDWSKGSTAIFKSCYESFPWYAEGINGFVDVNDVVNAMIMAADSEVTNERFIISSENKSYKEVFTAIANSFNKQPPTQKVNSFLAAIVWRFEAVKYLLTGKKPLVTKETAKDSLATRRYDGTKITKLFPQFAYTAIEETINRVCGELKEKYQLQ